MMTQFYTQAYADSQKKAYRKWLAASLLTAFTALLICIALCFFVTTRNATALFLAAVAISIAAGWSFILYLSPRMRACRAEYRHCENILDKTETVYSCGRISVSPALIKIPGSIRVRDVRLERADGKESYHLNANFSLPPDGTSVRLSCVGKYVTGYEVTDDA